MAGYSFVSFVSFTSWLAEKPNKAIETNDAISLGMKIISIGSDRNLFQDGSGVQARTLFYSAVADETHIIVFALRSLGLQEKKLSDKVFLYPTNSFSRFAYVFDAYRVGRRVFKRSEIRDQRSETIISTQDAFEAGLVGYFLKKKFGLPLQLQIHTDFLNSYFIRESLLNRVRVVVAKFLLPRADCIRVVSERIRRTLKAKSYNPKANVLPAFVDFQRIIDAPIKTDLRKKYPNRFIILMASRLTKEKNIASAVAAMREIVKDHLNALLLIVGDGHERKALELQAISYQLQANIVFEPWANDLASYYKTSDLFLVSSFYEGYGRTILEALACGCPVAATKVGIADEVIQDGENGFLIASPDAVSIATTLRKAIAAQNIFAMREKARESGARFAFISDEYLRQFREAFAICQNR